jgi:hypothetical protein
MSKGTPETQTDSPQALSKHGDETSADVNQPQLDLGEESTVGTTANTENKPDVGNSEVIEQAAGAVDPNIAKNSGNEEQKQESTTPETKETECQPDK